MFIFSFQVLDKYTIGHQLSIPTYCALSLVPLVLICQIRNLKYLVPFSAIANCLILFVFGITMYYMFTDLPSIKDTDRELVASPAQWPLFLRFVAFYTYLSSPYLTISHRPHTTI